MENKKEVLSVVKKLVGIAIGQFIAASGYTLILSANGLVPNGLGGIAQIIHRLTGPNVQLTLALLALPIFIWAFFCYEKKQIFYALYSFSMFTFYTGIVGKLLPAFQPDERILVVIVGGVVQGTAAGIIMKQRVANGPEAVIAMYIKKKTGMTIGTFLTFVNLAVICSSFFFFKDIEIIIYSILTTTWQGVVTDRVIFGFEKYYSVTIMSDYYVEITEYIQSNYHRNVTFMQAMDTDNVQKKMLCHTVVTKPEFVDIKGFIESFDDDSFVYAEECNMAIGKGIEIDG